MVRSDGVTSGRTADAETRTAVSFRHSAHRRAPLGLLLALAALLLPTTPALAGTVHIYSSSFGPGGNGESAFEHPGAIGLDQSSGAIYVADPQAGAVFKFDENHQPAEFTAGPGAGSAEITGFTFSPGEAAVGQIAVNPMTHDFFVVDDAPANSIQAFHADGEPANFVATPGSSEIGGFGELCGVAVDSAGDIYAADFHGAVDVYAPSGEALTNFETPQPCNLAVDSHGAVYVNHYHSEVDKYAPSAFPPTGTTTYGRVAGGDPLHVYGLAVDPTTDDLYANQETQIVQYDASGSRLATLPAGGEPGALSASEGVAVRGSSDTVYVSDAQGAHQVEVFIPPPPLPPSIDSTSVAEVGLNSANLRARVNPNYFDTHAHFEYVTQTQFEEQGGFANAFSTPEIDLGSSGGSEGARSAGVHIQSLQPETIYRYRIVATNSISPVGGTPGPERTFTTQFETTGESESCPNTVLRTEATSLALPDCRAYELVSPPEKAGSDVFGISAYSGGGLVESSPDGNSATFVSSGSFAGSQSSQLGNQYLAKRTAAGWSSHAINPPGKSGTGATAGRGTAYRAFSADLSGGVLQQVGNSPLSPVALQGYNNIYRYRDGDGSFQSLLESTPPPIGGTFFPYFSGASADFEHIVFAANDALTDDSHPPAVLETESNLYDAFGGALYPINVLPGEAEAEADPNAVLGFGSNAGPEDVSHAVSDDGSRIFWSSFATNGLYVRENDTSQSASTVQIDAGQGGLKGGSGEFWLASADGSRAFFVDQLPLTEDSGPPAASGHGDLYVYDVGSRTLTDLTPNTNSQEVHGPNVLGVLGGAEDGSSVYFVAGAALAAQNPEGGTPVSGSPNLYLWHQGQPIRFIATLSEADEGDWTHRIDFQTAKVTPDGSRLAFTSALSLTGYENDGKSEVFIYDAQTSSLSCVSCNSSGAVPEGASTLPTWTGISIVSATYQSRYFTDDGRRLFFDSADALVPRDSNGTEDVYEWEEGGTGSCPLGSASGCIFLISKGTGSGGSLFTDASEGGGDVFFISVQRLVGQDVDQNVDLYDARVDGGFPAPPIPTSCEGEACRPSPAASPAGLPPASATFAGAHNPKTPRHKKKHHRRRGASARSTHGKRGAAR